MPDSTLNRFVGRGSTAERLAFIPDPPTPVSGPDAGYLFWDTDTVSEWAYDFDAVDWVELGGGGGSGNVTAAGTLANNELVIGQGTTAVATTTTGTGILTALGEDIETAGAPVLFNGPGGTPSSITLPNATGFPYATGGTGVLPGANGGGLVLIQQIVTSGSQATVDFTSIPATYKTLKVVWFAQDTTANASASDLRVRVNNDSTSGNYTAANRIGSSGGAAFATTAAAASGGAQISQMPNASNTGMTDAGELTIPGYAATTFHKRILSICGNEFGATGQVWTAESRWKSTAAINQLTFTTGGTAFTDGSTFALYGLN